MRGDFCLWLVPSHDGRVKKLRFTYRRIIALLFLSTLLLTSLVIIAGDYTRIQFLGIRHSVLLQEVQAQRTKLANSNALLQAELEKLKGVNTRVLAYQTDVRKRLEELSSVIESATSLGMLEEGADGDPIEGVGGAEVDCTPGAKAGTCLALADDVIDPTSVDEVSDGDTRRAQLDLTFFAGAPQTMSDQQALGITLPRHDEAVGMSAGILNPELVSEISRSIDFVKRLPLGTPGSGKISSRFGRRISPFSGTPKMHEGIDIALSRGSHIRCAGAGVVRAAEFKPTYGLMIDVEHSPKVITRYAHLSRLMVRPGQKVKLGQLLGLAGSTGRSTGPHLHYEVRVNGRAHNPKKFIDLRRKLTQFLS